MSKPDRKCNTEMSWTGKEEQQSQVETNQSDITDIMGVDKYQTGIRPSVTHFAAVR